MVGNAIFSIVSWGLYWKYVDSDNRVLPCYVSVTAFRVPSVFCPPNPHRVLWLKTGPCEPCNELPTTPDRSVPGGHSRRLGSSGSRLLSFCRCVNPPCNTPGDLPRSRPDIPKSGLLPVTGQFACLRCLQRLFSIPPPRRFPPKPTPPNHHFTRGNPHSPIFKTSNTAPTPRNLHRTRNRRKADVAENSTIRCTL